MSLGGIKNDKHRSTLRHISDIFDEARGNIQEDVALTKFDNYNHVILFNTRTPDLNGKTLIPFDNDKLLFAPIDLKMLICSDPRNNDTVNILSQPKNKQEWFATSDEGLIKLLIIFNEKTKVAGYSIRYADATKTKYRSFITLMNNKDDILSQIAKGVESSWDTNNQQFYQFTNEIDGVEKVIIDLQVVGTNVFEWKLDSVILYSNMNQESLKSLSDIGVIQWEMVPNTTNMKDSSEEVDQILKMSGQEKTLNQMLKADKSLKPMLAANLDHYGTDLMYKPISDREFFDNIPAPNLVKMTNMTRMYAETNLSTGDKIFTFETKPDDPNLTLKFSPQNEMNKYPDQTVYDINELLKVGRMKEGGFKNYVLTMYVKLDGINTTNQFLVWRYGGFYYNEKLPQMARGVNVQIPINNVKNDIPHVYTEYFFGKYNDMTGRMVIIDGDFKGLEEGKWIGLQFMRMIDTESKHAKQVVRINKDPYDEERGVFKTDGFRDYIVYDDIELQDHIPHVWGGVNDFISITGAKYVNLYGISMYEIEKDDSLFR